MVSVPVAMAVAYRGRGAVYAVKLAWQATKGGNFVEAPLLG
jgi:hypothetical protein